MPAAEIKGQDPNVVRLPGATIKGTDRPDDETAKVMSNIAATATRAKGYLTNSKTEIIMAVDAFRGTALAEIDALDFDPPDSLSLVPTLVSTIGSVVSLACPPVAGVAIAINFTTALAAGVQTASAKAEGDGVKAALKNNVAQFSRATNDAQSSALNSADGRIGPALNDLAATDKGIWDLLLIGGERQQDDLISRLGVRDPAKQSPYGTVLTGLMQAFGGWMGKAKAQKDMTGSERLISDYVPGSEEFDARKKAEAAGIATAVDAAKLMTEQHAGGK